MKYTKIELPSNKKFGFFFTVVFLIIASYFFLSDRILISYVFFVFTAILLLITFINEHALLPLNKLWMRFGHLIGTIISPIVLGVIFFGIFTPYSLLMRLFGRDELKLKLVKSRSYWKLRIQSMPLTNFRKQF
ncbi:SxtJ family membrane protein [Candidatus Pelagibacter bacterium]|jgi:hypothetical protein|nr:SxtJ family membrane protein [Candidatus Pelagibacter bacterium]